MRLLFLVFGFMGVVPYQDHVFKQASQTRKQTKFPPPGFLQAPARKADSLPPTALGTQRPLDCCPSTRKTFLEDRNCCSLLLRFPRARTLPLQRLGTGGRYRNMHLLPLNLALVCHEGMWWLRGRVLFLQQ